MGEQIIQSVEKKSIKCNKEKKKKRTKLDL